MKQQAMDAGIHCFDVESTSELERLSGLAVRQRSRAPVALRINPDVDAGTHPYVATGLRETKFGIGMNDAMAAYRRAAELPGIRITGIAAHIGSQITEASPFEDALERMLTMVEALRAEGAALLGADIDFRYAMGWSRELSLQAALEEHLERDVAMGATQAGPHRADLRLVYDERQARRLVSRGQQKLLASAMILAATGIAQEAVGRPLLLLLDDPAAELDRDSLARLMERVAALGCQVIATSLERDELPFPVVPRVFHVEQGELRAAQEGP